jgi:hypothetical protein
MQKAMSIMRIAAPVVLLISGIGLLIFILVMSKGAFNLISDFPEFYAAAKLFAAGAGASIYNIPEFGKAEMLYYPSPVRTFVGYFSPPFALPLVLPLALLPVSVAPIIFKIFLGLCLAGAVYLIKLAFNLSRNAFLWMLAVLSLSGVVCEALRIDQVATVLFLSFAGGIWALKKDKPTLAAILLTGMIAKPHELLPFVLFLFGAKKYKTVAVLAGIVVAFTLVAYLAIGAQGFSNYLALMKFTLTDNTYLVSDISCTLRGQLFRYFPDHRMLMHYISLAALLPSLALIFYMGHKSARRSDWLELCLIGAMPLGIVTALYCYYYDLLVLVPAALLVLARYEKEVPPLMILGGMLGGLVFMLPFSLLIQMLWLNTGHHFNPHFVALVLWALCGVWFVFKKLRQAETADQREQSGI